MARSKRPKTETMSVNDTRKNFSEVVTRLQHGKGRVIVEQAGTPVGAIVSIEDIRRLEDMDREWAGIEDVLQRTSSGFTGVPDEDIEWKIENAIAELEAEHLQGGGCHEEARTN